MSERDYWPHFGERFGFLPQVFRRTGPDGIWLHAVSVGEVASAVPLLRQWRERSPHTPLWLSTSTVAGRGMAKRNAAGLADGIFYAPFDFAWCVRRVLRMLRPSAVVVLETEIWPHLFFEVKRTGARLVLANARISTRTWPRYRRWRWFFAPLLRLPDAIFAQSAIDAAYYRELSGNAAAVKEAGNLKYDAVSDAAARLDLPLGQAHPIWIAASTVGPNERGSLRDHAVDEDDLVLDAFAQLRHEFPSLLLVIAPRQPQRFDAVGEKLRTRGVPFVRRTAMSRDARLHPPVPGVLLLDTVGELARCYGWADAVFVGGSLAPRGGHNILEPAAAGAPVVVGPHMENFAAIAADFKAAGAMVQIGSADELARAVRELLAVPAAARALGARGRELVTQKRGAVREIAAEVERLRAQTFTCKPRNMTAAAALRLLAEIWTQGGKRKRRRGEAFAQTRAPLHVPVVSIGGITVGGSGKTPFCNHLAAELKRRGYTPAILTRGYRRRSPAKVVVLPAGSEAPHSLTGDEAQIFLRAGQAAVGIGADRYQVAQVLLREMPEVDVLLLDDGFQHARLPRDADIVLIDGLDPFGGQGVLPLGRLREPLQALGRASAFVITRAPNPARYEAICRELQRQCPETPIFRADLQPHRWRSCISEGLVLLEPGARVGAFCGLGNPANFWRTLERLGLEVAFEWAFGDHHLYKPAELRRLVELARARQVDVLVTTEKDSVNLPPGTAALLGGMPLAWLPIELRLQAPDSFFTALSHLIAQPAFRKK